MDLKIRIIEKKQAEENLSKPVPEGVLLRGEIKEFSILEGGMVSGKTSVALVAKLDDGSDVFLETSADLFNAMHSALAGAEIRFAKNKETNSLNDKNQKN